MTTELDTLVRSVYVVGGRALRAQPPGALVQKAPRRAARPRAQDTFFALLTLSAEGRASAPVFEALVQRAAEVYFKSTGTITAGLREAILAVNSDLMDRNRQTGAGYKANLVVSALHGGEVYIAQGGGGMSWLQQSGAVTAFPDDPADLRGKWVGTGTNPDIRLTRHTVAPGDVLVFSDQAFAASAQAGFDAALKGESVEAVADALKPLAGNSAAALVLLIASPDQVETAEVEAIQVQPEAAEGEPAAGARKPSESPRRRARWPAPPASLARPGASLRRIGATIGEANLGGRLRAAVAGLALAVSNVAGGFNRLLDVFFPEPVEGEGGARIPTPLAAGATVLIAVAVTVVVVGLMLRNYGRDSCDEFLSIAEQEAAEAKTLTGHPSEAREAWQAVRLHLEQAVEVCPPSDRRPLDALDEARGFIDEYDQVVRPRPAVQALRTYPAGVQMIAPVLHDPEIYTLDVGNVALYRDQLKENGYELVEENTRPVLKKGDRVEGYLIERLVDVEWLSEGSVNVRNVLLTLEPTSGIMIAYSPTLGASAIPLLDWQNWQEPSAIAAWGGNLYILDPAADQVWRYRVAQDTGEYSAPPERYFENINTQPDLAGAIDMAIDDQGNIYVLFADGQVTKFWGGEEQEFALTGLPLALKEVRSMFLDSSLLAQALYLVDAGNESIFETTLRGNFRYHYRPANEATFKDLRGIFVSANRDVYMTAGNALYYFNKSGGR